MTTSRASQPGWTYQTLVVLLFIIAGCYPYNPQIDNATFQACCGALGTCIPAGLVPAKLQSELATDTCQQDLLCVPTVFAENSKHVAKTCRAAGNAEGRCLASCLPDVIARAKQLERGACDEGESCVPCFDPRDGAETGVCQLGADPGPAEPPQLFPRCCGDTGRCVPLDVVARDAGESDLSRLSRRDCAEPETLCVEGSWLEDSPTRAATCRSIGEVEGRCVSRCIAELDGPVELPRDSCASDEACAPCYDPMKGTDTGVCRRGGDAPVQPPRTFDTCCAAGGGQASGKCIPPTLLQSASEGDLRARLGPDSCRDETQLCVPMPWLEDAKHVPPKCRMSGDREGRCLPSCLPEIAERANLLQRASCSPGALCAPCFDPITGKDSEACRMGDDAPESPAVPFESCCGAGKLAAGRCLPRELLAEQSSSVELSALGADSCQEAGTLCVPEAWLDPAHGAPEACVTFGTFEGRCLPACLPAVAAQAGSLLREGCADNERCAPCYDPLTGAQTDACRSGDDKPTSASQRLASCCGSGDDALGRCMPRESLLQIAGTDASRFGQDSCTGTEQLCVPNSYVSAPRSAATTECRAVGDLEGRCLSTCLPEVAARASTLKPAGCGAGELCVPCYDPRDGTDTLACRSGTDTPQQQPQSTPRCCAANGETHGRCLASALVEATAPPETSPHLSRDTCTEPDALCVPEKWIAENPVPLGMCRSIGDLEGRCMPACLPDVALMAERLTSRGCEAYELCAPCYDPRTLEPTGVCTLNADKPREEPRGFARCCGTGGDAKGTCLPAEILTENQKAQLPYDTCRTYDSLCVPTQLTATPPEKLAQCDSLLGRGLCLDECFINADSVSLLSTSSCRTGQRCVPCSSLQTRNIGCE